MTRHPQLLALLGLGGAFAGATQDIAWGPCPEFPGATLPIQCGNLTVPLDYTRPTANETLILNLIRLPAIKESKGSILLNFGGPGVAGRVSLAAGGDVYQANTGGEYDLISWDPRGTANTLTYSCFDDPAERQILAAIAASANQSDVAVGTVWAQANMLADKCGRHEEARARADIISTPFVARDMMRIVDALGGDRRLRYWGLSYGTVLGATVAAMFPDRMERVVLDGVLNPFEYYFGYDMEMLSDTDATLAEFARLCVANATACPLAEKNATAASIEASVYALSDELKYRPVYGNGTIVDYNAFRGLVRFALYSPAGWPALAAGIRGLQRGDAAAAVAATAPPIVGAGDESPFGIHCADKDAPHRGAAATVDPFVPLFREAGERSRIIGDLVATLYPTCALWQSRAKETVDRDLFAHVRTSHPILFIGNSFDPATPLRSAFNSSSIFEDSVVLEHQGRGHSSIAEPSTCTAQTILDYFNGVVPAPNTKCGTDIKPFQPGNWTDLYPKLGYTPPTVASG